MTAGAPLAGRAARLDQAEPTTAAGLSPTTSTKELTTMTSNNPTPPEPTVAELAGTAAEAIRAANHRTLWPVGQLLMPDLYWREGPGADPDDSAAAARANGGVWTSGWSATWPARSSSCGRSRALTARPAAAG